MTEIVAFKRMTCAEDGVYSIFASGSDGSDDDDDSDSDDEGEEEEEGIDED